MHLSIRSLTVGLGLASFSCSAFIGSPAAWAQVEQRAVGPRTSQVLGPAAPNRQAEPQQPLRTASGPAPQNQAVPRQPLRVAIGPAPAAAAPVPQAPHWFPQPAEHQKYVADVLKFWEQSSSKIDRYRCKFRRWEYDPDFVKADPETGKSPAIKVSYGEIKYGRPDKGLFKVTKLLHYNAPKQPGEKAQYLPIDGEIGEHWVCDGKSIFEFDHAKKTLIDHQLPPEMQGQAIVDGPLPFLFGANAAKIQERYWVGVFTPKTAKGEYWLEAVPKRIEDARNYRKVEIIIDEADFLPKAMQIFNNGGDDRNPSSTVLTFEDREINFPVQSATEKFLDPFQLWMREFHEPATPLGWKKVIERFDKASGQQPPATANMRQQTDQAIRAVRPPQLPQTQKK